MNRDLKNKSKYLSLLLRHKPEAAGITLDEGGWALISELTDARKGGFGLHELNEIVTTDEKQRYQISDDMERIRAVQGHSAGVAPMVELEKAIPPGPLYHGTKEEVYDSIMREGLRAMNREYVHLTTNKQTAMETANRRKGRSVILQIDWHHARADGLHTYRAANGVWLMSTIEPKYIKVAE